MSNNAEQSVLNFASVLLALGSTNNNNDQQHNTNNGDDDQHSIAATSEYSEANTSMSTSDVKSHPMLSSLSRAPSVSQSTVMSMFHGHTSIFTTSSSSSSQSSQKGMTNTAMTTIETGNSPRNMTLSTAASSAGMIDTVDGEMKRHISRRRSVGSSSSSGSSNHTKHHHESRMGTTTSHSQELMMTTSHHHQFPLAQPCRSQSVSTSQGGHTLGDQGSMMTFQGTGLPGNTQLAKTELQLLSALGRRTYRDESPDKDNHQHRDDAFSILLPPPNERRRRDGDGDGDDTGKSGNDVGMETEEEEDEDKEQSLKAAAAANRGKYKCSRCGAVKSNHHCPVMEQFTIADATQYERMVLTASEFNSTYVGKLSSSSSSALDTGAGSAGISIDLSGLSVANCLRMLPVRPNYVPMVPSHALKKPMRYHHSDNTTTTTTTVGHVDTSTNAAASGHTYIHNHHPARTHSNQGNAMNAPGGSQRQGSEGLQFLAPRILSPDEYVVDETGRNSITDMMHLNPGVLYLPIPTSFLIEGGGMQLAAMSLTTGEPVGVFTLTSTLVAGERNSGAVGGLSSSSSSFSQNSLAAGYDTELSNGMGMGMGNKPHYRNKQSTLPQESFKYQHQVVFQPIFVSPSVSHYVPTAAVALPLATSATTTMTSSSESMATHSNSTGTSTD